MLVLYIILIAIAFYLCGLVGVFLYGWHMNAVHGTHYDLAALLQMSTNTGTLIVGMLVNHSIFNTHIPALDRLSEILANLRSKQKNEGGKEIGENNPDQTGKSPGIPS